MMIPITRKEKYINEIAGGGNTAPKTPQTREEIFFAGILGEVVAPSPVTRVEKYLSAIAGQYGGDLPTPMTRIEYFLAKAAGMEIETPIPITREEMLWDTYIPIKTIEGIPPLTFKAKKAGTLKNYRIYGNTETKTRSYSGAAPLSFPIEDGAVSNYRIYGNTVNGESVGDLVTDSQSEHYGKYAIPITNNSETANIYLNEPLRKVGENADYIDYAEQKRYNADGTSGDVTLPALPAQSSSNSLSVGTAVQPSSLAVDVAEVVSCGDKVTDSQSVNYGKYKIPLTLTADSAETTDIYLDEPLKKGRIYGFHIDPSVSDSSNAVTYIADAVGKTPAAMGANTFSYGDWENAFFMPKPCMLKSDGTVDYYLDPNDYTKKADGTPSDVANANYDGNAMMEWGKIWYKFVPTETDGEVSFYVADYKADNDFECWCNIDSQNNETDHFYTAIYNGTGTEKLRSISGVALTSENGNGGTTATQEVERATANNTTNNVEWYTEVYSDRMLINMLLVLMGKSLNSQAVYGKGLVTGSQASKEAYTTGTLNDKGLFWGDISTGTSGVKVFGMENYWGCIWHRTAGLISIDNHAYTKLTYSTADGSSTTGYNQTGNGYLDLGSIPNTNGWVKTMKYNHKGFIPSMIGETNADSNYYYGDYFYQNTDTRYLLLGGHAGHGTYAGSDCFNLNSTPASANWAISTALSCKPMSKGSNPHTADYIDYMAQKRHNSDGTESSITLPAISTLAGTNTLTVGTEVQPSSVEIKGRIKAAGGD